jgi:hypothetical protein
MSGSASRWRERLMAQVSRIDGAMAHLTEVPSFSHAPAHVGSTAARVCCSFAEQASCRNDVARFPATRATADGVVV